MSSGEEPPVNLPELRVALVMNGGVSLAVWMGGVTAELDRLRRCHMSTDSDDDPTQAWKKILAASRRPRVVVDTIAGSSAGGLNGTLLATAIAHGVPLPDLKSLWLSDATLTAGRLIRDLRTDGSVAPTRTSLLDGDFFHRRVAEVLDTLGEQGPDERQPAECTLLVTATSLWAPSTPISTGGSRAPVKRTDGRRVYAFRRLLPSAPQEEWEGQESPGRNDFDDLRALAQVARGSASFPAAFEPVPESHLRKYRVQSLASAQTGVGEFLIDGGVLDNAPFEPLLGALRRRAVGAPFDRTLIYVRPTVQADRASPPNAARVLSVLGAVVSRLRETDDRLDLDALLASFESMSLTRSDPHRLLDDALDDPDTANDIKQAARALLPTYRMARSQTLRYQAQVAISGPGLFSLPPSGIDLFPDLTDVQWGPSTNWTWGLATAERCLRWWGRLATERYKRVATSPDTFLKLAQAQRLVEDDRTRLNALLGEGLATRPDVTPDDWIERARDLLEVIGFPERAARMMHDTAQTLEGALHVSELIELTLAIEVIVTAVAWRADNSSLDTPQFNYLEINPDAAALPGVVTPSDPKWSQRKLYGERWGHFGAFASRKGRRWDWLWGRLDAASTLSTALLSDHPDAERLKADLLNAILSTEADWDLDELNKRADYMSKNPLDMLRLYGEDLDSSKKGRRTIPILISTVANLPHDHLPWSGISGWAHHVLDTRAAEDDHPDLDRPGWTRQAAGLLRGQLGAMISNRLRPPAPD
jgi:predicted acylesterase/phospholipase RssA